MQQSYRVKKYSPAIKCSIRSISDETFKVFETLKVFVFLASVIVPFGFSCSFCLDAERTKEIKAAE